MTFEKWKEIELEATHSFLNVVLGGFHHDSDSSSRKTHARSVLYNEIMLDELQYLEEKTVKQQLTREICPHDLDTSIHRAVLSHLWDKYLASVSPRPRNVVIHDMKSQGKNWLDYAKEDRDIATNNDFGYYSGWLTANVPAKFILFLVPRYTIEQQRHLFNCLYGSVVSWGALMEALGIGDEE